MTASDQQLRQACILSQSVVVFSKNYLPMATKGNRTPEAAGMKLSSKPKAPVHPAIAFADQFWKAQADTDQATHNL